MDRGLRSAKDQSPSPSSAFYIRGPPGPADVMGAEPRGGAAGTAAPREGAGARCEVRGIRLYPASQGYDAPRPVLLASPQRPPELFVYCRDF